MKQRFVVVVDVVDVVLVLTRMLDQVRGYRTGSSHSGVHEYPRKKTQTKTKVVHAYIIADAMHASARKI